MGLENLPKLSAINKSGGNRGLRIASDSKEIPLLRQKKGEELSESAREGAQRRYGIISPYS